MADKTWKSVERRIAALLGGKRNPLSGANSGHTAGDVIHDTFYVEIKHRQKIPFYADFERSMKDADVELKPLLFVFHQKKSKRNIIMMDLQEFLEFTDANKKHPFATGPKLKPE